MNKTKPEAYIDAEKELILLMGFENPVLGSQTRKFHAKTEQAGKTVMKEFPQWGRDNGAALALIPQYGLLPDADETKATVTYNASAPNSFTATESAEEHGDHMAALRMALLRAAIAKQTLLNERSAK